MKILKKDGTTDEGITIPKAARAPGEKESKVNKKVERRTGPSPVTLTTTVTKTVKIS